MVRDARLEAMGLAALPRRRRWYQDLAYWARKKPLGTISAIILFGIIVVAIFAEFVAPFGAKEAFLAPKYSAPSSSHLLGTDELGRDVLSRLIHGSRISLYVGFGAIGLATAVGVILGLTSAYFAGALDALMQRVIDAWMAFPAIILALTIMTVFKPDISLTLIVIGIVIVPLVTRVVRGATFAIKANMYVDAAKAIGAGDTRIIFRHILPNVFAPVIVLASVLLGGAIIVEASLSFLGLGAPADSPSWGNMIQTGREHFETAWWLPVAPGVAISLTVFSFNLLGDALRDILDPRLRGAGASRLG